MNTPETVQSVQDRLRVKRLLLIERWIDEELTRPKSVILSPNEVRAHAAEQLLKELAAENNRLRYSVSGVSPLHEVAKAPPQLATAADLAVLRKDLDALAEQQRDSAARLHALETAMQAIRDGALSDCVRSATVGTSLAAEVAGTAKRCDDAIRDAERATDAADGFAQQPATADGDSEIRRAVWPLRRAAFIAGYEQAMRDAAKGARLT